MFLVKNVSVYAPEPRGNLDVFIAGNRIAAVEAELDLEGRLPGLQVIDGAEFLAVPGFIDSHVHITGGGGEGGFTTRTPELQLTQFTTAGVTSVVGTLGTDGTTRSMADLLAKVYALSQEGVSAWCYSGSYELPPRTLTGKVSDDIILIEKVIGAGEIAIADHRSSQPDLRLLADVASQARLGGILSGKAGIVNLHLGDHPDGLSLLEELCSRTAIPRKQFVPTHMGRNPGLFRRGLKWGRESGYLDYTTCTVPEFLEEGEVKCSRALRLALEAGVPVERISFSSDAGGSLPSFDDDGNLKRLEVGTSHTLFSEVRDAVKEEGLSLETAIQVITTTPADHLKLDGKGRIQAGADADIVLLQKDSLEIRSVISSGRLMVEQGQPLVKGRFE